MADREKVIKGLECCSKDVRTCAVCPYDKEMEISNCEWDLSRDALELLKEQEWIPISERLPENANHPGEFCPRVRVMTVWGESYGWFNPDKNGWYFLVWFTEYSTNTIDFERGDIPSVCYTPRDTKLITHWKPIP